MVSDAAVSAERQEKVAKEHPASAVPANNNSRAGIGLSTQEKQAKVTFESKGEKVERFNLQPGRHHKEQRERRL